jgi:hypothetical protein
MLGVHEHGRRLPSPRESFAMSHQLRVLLVLIGWTGAVTLIHLALNTRVLEFRGETRAGPQFRVGFLPVT